MGGVDITVQQADGDALDAARIHVLQQAVEPAAVERLEHLAARVDAFGYGPAILARHQQVRFVDEYVVLLVAALVSDFDDVAKARGRNQTDTRTLAFDQGVGRKRGAVYHRANRSRSATGVAAGNTHNVDDTAHRVVAGG